MMSLSICSEGSILGHIKSVCVWTLDYLSMALPTSRTLTWHAQRCQSSDFHFLLTFVCTLYHVALYIYIYFILYIVRKNVKVWYQYHCILASIFPTIKAWYSNIVSGMMELWMVAADRRWHGMANCSSCIARIASANGWRSIVWRGWRWSHHSGRFNLHWLSWRIYLRSMLCLHISVAACLEGYPAWRKYGTWARRLLQEKRFGMLRHQWK